MADERLKLGALDAEDLAIISAHLQDAVLKMADMTFRPSEQRFAAVVNRFDWSHGADRRRGPWRRRRAALSFDRVTAVRTLGLDRAARERVLSLLAIEFNEADAPGGEVTLVFSGGGAVQLDVECIEMRLADLGAVWETASRPSHEVGDDGAE